MTREGTCEDRIGKALRYESNKIKACVFGTRKTIEGWEFDADDPYGSYLERNCLSIDIDIEFDYSTGKRDGEYRQIRGAPFPRGQRFDFAAEVCMSTGGPADYWVLYYHNHRLVAAYYVYQDWFDGSYRRVSNGSRTFQAIETMFDFLTDYQPFQQWTEC